MTKHSLRVMGGRLLLFLVILVGAELGVRYGVLSPLFFSSPSEIFAVFKTQLAEGTLLVNTWITVMETTLGLIAGSLLGMALGLLLPSFG